MDDIRRDVDEIEELSLLYTNLKLFLGDDQQLVITAHVWSLSSRVLHFQRGWEGVVRPVHYCQTNHRSLMFEGYLRL